MQTRSQLFASLLAFCVLTLACMGFSSSAQALEGNWTGDTIVHLRLVSSDDAIGAQDRVELGLDVALAPGWHTYWRSPGIAGTPPQIEWKGTTDQSNLASAELLFPAPQRYINYGLETIGYTDQILFPIDAKLARANAPLTLKATVSILVCETLCIPKVFDLSLTIPTGNAKKGTAADLIRHAKETLPQKGILEDLKISSTEYGDDVIRLTLDSKKPIERPDVFVESKDDLLFQPPKVELGRDKLKARFTLKLEEPLKEGKKLETVPLRLTFITADSAFELSLGKEKFQTIFDLLDGSPKNESSLSLYMALLLAFVGGFLLNLMPCVLPVLSIKLLALVKHGGNEHGEIRKSLFMTSLGILTTFLILALITFLLKVAGLSMGWGIQYQQPIFLFCLVIVLLLFSMSLLGLYDIPLPRCIAKRLTTPAQRNMATDFATGAFATILATPCSAPFLGTAVGFALTASFMKIVLIFLFLGLGMSLPYILVFIKPQWVSKLPKPGIWMVYLRQAMGLVLMLTALWFATIFYTVAFSSKTDPTYASHEPGSWETFSQEAMNRALAQGKTVFVDVTADWCLTCRANGFFVLKNEEVMKRLFNDSHVVAFKADWTHSEKDISDFLKRYNRYGIPFNIVIGAGAPDGIVLPEILTKDRILNALEQAQGAGRVK